jgi:hypothetical protein
MYASMPRIGFTPCFLAALVGECERRHVELVCARDQVLDLDRSVEQAVLGVGVQMDERCRHDAF